MSAVEFDTQVVNGTIEIPLAHRADLVGPVHVIVLPQSPANATPAANATIIDRLIAKPLNVPGFVPFTREEAHG